MIVVDEKRCTGCSACVKSCPVNAITMVTGKYGFLYPSVNEEQCIQCGRCERACHLNSKEQDTVVPLGFYAFRLKDEKLLNKVSSGGAFLAIALLVLEKNGIVYGAIQKDIRNVQHVRINSKLQLDELCRSKYIQSDISQCFEQIKADVKTYKEVLFCGTACQTNAILSYLGYKPENLILCDIVCHGVPAPEAYNKYCDEIEKKYQSEIASIVFRDKSAGWNCNHYCITFKSGNVLREKSNFNAFHGAYLQGLMYRPSCEACRYAKLTRKSDLVFADYWKYEGKLKEGNRGVSLVVAYTQKGEKLMQECEKLAQIEVTTREQAEASCHNLSHAPVSNKRRIPYLNLVERKGYFKAFYRYAYVRIILSKIKFRIKNLKGK